MQGNKAGAKVPVTAIQRKTYPDGQLSSENSKEYRHVYGRHEAIPLESGSVEIVIKQFDLAAGDEVEKGEK